MLRLSRLIFGLILALNALERWVHADLYYERAFFGVPYAVVLGLLFFLCLLFAFTRQRSWALVTFILNGISAQGAPSLLFGLDLVSSPFLLYFCFVDVTKEAKWNRFVTSLLVVQTVVMYAFNGWSKLQDPVMWKDGTIFRFMLKGHQILTVVPPQWMAVAVIALQLSSVLLFSRRLRRTWILLLGTFHVLVVGLIGLPFFQLVCLLQLAVLWDFTARMYPAPEERA